MKKTTKPIILSALTALAFGAVGTAGTFALFTDKAETTVSVEAGVVDLDTEISELKFFELNNDEEITTTNTAGAKVNSIGGTAKLDGTTLTLDKWAPGDKVTFKITVKNKSNVKTKTRLRVTHTSNTAIDLYDALSLDCVASGSISSEDVFHWSELDASNDTANGEEVSVISVTIEFPNIGNEITAREEGINNQYQGAGCIIKFTQQAVQANANLTDIVSELNAILESPTSTQVNKSLSAAIAETGTTSALLQSEHVVWNVKQDKFYYEEEAADNRNDYFKVQDELSDVQKYSVYASENWNDANVEVKGVGFDVGDAATISNISYLGVGEARENSIYTNSPNTNLTIDAELDTVHHSGNVGVLTIIAVAGSSYHEYGKAAFVKVSKGRIALEETAEVQRIHVEKKADEEAFDDIIIAKDEAVDLPTLSRDKVEIDEQNGTLVLAIQNGTEEVTSTTELDYVWLTKEGVFEQVAISDNDQTPAQAATPTEIKYADDDENSEVTQIAAQQIANNISENVLIGETAYTVTVDPVTRDLVVKDNNEQVVTVEETVANVVEEALNEKGLTEAQKEAAIEETHTIAEVEDNADYVARIGTAGYATLYAAMEAATAEGTTIKVLRDHQMDYSTAKSSYAFVGDMTIDLGGHTVINTRTSLTFINNQSFTLKNGNWATTKYFGVKAGMTFTFKDLGLTFAGSSQMLQANYKNDWSATFDHCTLSYTGSYNNGNQVIVGDMSGSSNVSVSVRDCDIRWNGRLWFAIKSQNNCVVTIDEDSIDLDAFENEYIVTRETTKNIAMSTEVVGGEKIYSFTNINAQNWVDVVTSAPEGYVVDAGGNVTISTPEALAYWNRTADSFEGKTVSLAADIEMAGYDWTPVHNGTNVTFAGTFDGNNHTISGLVEKNGIAYGGGMFRSVSGTVRNLKIERSNIGVGTNDGNIVGVLAGYVEGGSTFDNIHVKNCKVSGYGKVGGLIGMSEGNGITTISNCVVENVLVDASYNASYFVGLAQNGITLSNDSFKGCTFVALQQNDEPVINVTNAVISADVNHGEEACELDGETVTGSYRKFYDSEDEKYRMYMLFADFYNVYEFEVHAITVGEETLSTDGVVMRNAAVVIDGIGYSEGSLSI